MRILFKLLAGLVLLVGQPSFANDLSQLPGLLQLNSATPQQPVGRQIEYLLGHEQLSFEQIAAGEFAGAWQRQPRASLNLRIQRQGAWLKFDLSQPSGPAQPWFLVLKWPMLDRIELRLYHHASASWSAPQLAGTTLPNSGRALGQRLPVFPLSLAPGERVTAYLHVQAYAPLIVPMAVMDQSNLHSQELLDSILISLFFGAMLVMLLYNASLWLFTRDRSYGYYSLYLLMWLGYALATTGFGPLYLGLDQPWLAIRMYTVCGTLCFVFGGLFFHHFLDLQRQGGWIKWLNYTSIGYWLLASLLLLLAPYSALVHQLNPQLMSLVTIFFGLSSSIYLWAKGNPSARLFTLAWSLLIVCTVAHMLALSGHLPLNNLTLNGQLLGVAVELTLLSIALAERINRERAKRLQAQQDILDYAERLALEREEKLHAQQQTLRIQRQANEELEQRVQQRTQDLKQTNLRLEGAIAQLARLSQIDPLTELYNRRHFDESIQQELCRAKRNQTPLALLMIDIDHFKALNDNYGHPFGDECLRAVAALLQQFSQRAGDLAARYGGEEFILVLSGANRTAAGRVAEKLRQAIADLRLEQAGQTVRFSTSIGFTAQVPNLETSVGELIKSADEALYRAKREGRNRVVVAAGQDLD